MGGFGDQPGGIFPAAEAGGRVMGKKQPEYMLLNDCGEIRHEGDGPDAAAGRAARPAGAEVWRGRARGEVVVTDQQSGEETNLGVEPIPAEVFRDIPSEH